MFQYKIEKESTMLEVQLDTRVKDEFMYSEFADLDLVFTNPSNKH